MMPAFNRKSFVEWRTTRNAVDVLLYRVLKYKRSRCSNLQTPERAEKVRRKSLPSLAQDARAGSGPITYSANLART